MFKQGAAAKPDRLGEEQKRPTTPHCIEETTNYNLVQQSRWTTTGFGRPVKAEGTFAMLGVTRQIVLAVPTNFA
jgi:hypothetical protein